MKKLVGFSLLVIGLFIIANCEISFQKTKGRSTDPNYGSINRETQEPGKIDYVYQYYGGMKYVVVSTYAGGLTSINLTKDSLDCELAKIQLAFTNDTTIILAK